MKKEDFYVHGGYGARIGYDTVFSYNWYVFCVKYLILCTKIAIKDLYHSFCGTKPKI